ncbi:universal stress protein [Leptolyngbya sp. AN02str]|uniref:universal stress protein n=1 Tax=Leptolyngbya sp. AN02str TaxID=3423363 RepID=UPI003D318A0C
MAISKILVAIDHSLLGQSVFEQALDLAVKYQAELMLFHCLTQDMTTGPMLLPGELGLSSHMISQAYQSQQIYLEQHTQQLQDMFQHYVQQAHEHGIAAQWLCRHQEPGLGICQAAQHWGADLIVVGRRGRKGLAEAVLGSVSNYVLHHANCAVFVIQTPQTFSVPLVTKSTPNVAESPSKLSSSHAVQ